ncbi:hypothetical protein D3C85_753010 [compost metagenome]
MAGGQAVAIGGGDEDRQAHGALASQGILEQQIERQLGGKGQQGDLHHFPLRLPLPPEQGGQHGVEGAVTGAGDEPADPGLWPVVGMKQTDAAHPQVPLLDLVHHASCS